MAGGGVGRKYAKIKLIAGSTFLSIVSAHLGMASAEPAPRRYTVDDQLKLEQVGIGTTDPSGRWFLWEQSFPYDSLGDYGIGALQTAFVGDFHLMAFDNRSGVVAPLFRPSTTAAYRLGNFSPDGRHVSFLRIQGGDASLGIYTLLTRRVQMVNAAPRVDIADGFQPTWLDNRRIIFAAYPKGGQPWAYSFRRGIARLLRAQWERAWGGKETSSNVQVSGGVSTASRLAGRLLEFSLITTRVTQIASGQFESLSRSPDGRFLAALLDSPRDSLTADNRSDWVRNRTRLAIFNVDSHRQMQVLQDLEIVPDSIEWAPDSDRVAFFGWKVGSSLSSGIFYALDVNTGRLARFPHTGLDLASRRERGEPEWPEREVWLNGNLAVFARKNDDGSEVPQLSHRDVGSTAALTQANWYLLSESKVLANITSSLSDVSPVPLFSDGDHLWVLASGAVWRTGGSGAPQRVTIPSLGYLGLPPIQFTTVHIPFVPVIVLVANSPSGSKVIFLDCRDGESEEFPIKLDSNIMAVSDRSKQALLHDGVGKSSEVILKTPKGRTVVLSRLNGHLKDIPETIWKPFHYSSVDGGAQSDLVGCLLLPTGFDPDRKYPLIVDVYPARIGRCGDTGHYGGYDAMGAYPGSYSEHLLSGRGYVVFRPDTRVNLESTPSGPLGGLDRIVSRGVDALIAQGSIDGGRLGLIGFSQGGFASLWLATQDRRFRATVSVSGWSDMYSEYFEQNLVEELVPDEWPPSGDSERYLANAGTDFGIGKSPSQAPLTYLNNSPLFQATRVSSPVLMIGTDMDVFKLEQYQMMFDALYQNNLPAELVFYRGEGHGPSGPANIRDMWDRIDTWFDKYIDVSRGTNGEILWEGGQVRSRAPAE